MLLLQEEHLALLGVPEEHLHVERLAEVLLAVLPHLVQLGPAVLQRLQTLPQEHVLGVVVGRGDVLGRDVLAVLHHLRESELMNVVYRSSFVEMHTPRLALVSLKNSMEHCHLSNLI